MILKEFIRAILREGTVLGPKVTDAEKRDVPALQRPGRMHNQVLQLGARYERIWISDPSGRIDPTTGKPARFPVQKKMVDSYVWLKENPTDSDPHAPGAWFKRFEVGDDDAADGISPLTPSQKIQDRRLARVTAAEEERARNAPPTVVRRRRNDETGEEESLTPVRRR
jgi:hypothetical protein